MTTAPATPAPPKKSRVSRKEILFIGAVLLVAAVVIGGRNQAGTRSTPSAPSRSDAALKATMAGNIAEFDSIADQIAGNGTDLAVTDRVLFVGSRLAADDTAGAEQLCRSIAAISNDPDTAQPLGLAGIIILAGGESVADCRP